MATLDSDLVDTLHWLTQQQFIIFLSSTSQDHCVLRSDLKSLNFDTINQILMLKTREKNQSTVFPQIVSSLE